MQFKTPLKIKILILNFKDDYFDGKIAIHENEYKIIIKPNSKNKLLRLPFQIIGVNLALISPNTNYSFLNTVFRTWSQPQLKLVYSK